MNSPPTHGRPAPPSPKNPLTRSSSKAVTPTSPTRKATTGRSPDQRAATPLRQPPAEPPANPPEPRHLPRLRAYHAALHRSTATRAHALFRVVPMSAQL